jgi:hypothetical protein
MRTRTLAVLGFAVAVGSCAGSRGATPPLDRAHILKPEIAATNANTAYDAVLQLRPNFLRGRSLATRSRTRTETPLVYMDGARLGELGQLRNIPTTIILSIQLISASDATTRWGTGHPAGVIEVRTR